MSYATLEALRAAVPSSGSTDHEDHTRGIVDALIAGLRPATVTLTSADILALNTTPITLVAAPGAGKMLMPHRVLCQYTYGTAAYVNGDGPPRLTLDNGQASVTLSGLIDQTTDYRKTFAIDFDTASDPANSALIVDDGGAAHTDGDGTLTVTVWYSVEDVP